MNNGSIILFHELHMTFELCILHHDQRMAFQYIGETTDQTQLQRYYTRLMEKSL